MSGKVLGWYDPARNFRCEACGPTGHIADEATTETGLDYAREQCASCGKWVDESGEETDEA